MLIKMRLLPGSYESHHHQCLFQTTCLSVCIYNHHHGRPLCPRTCTCPSCSSRGWRTTSSPPVLREGSQGGRTRAPAAPSSLVVPSQDLLVPTPQPPPAAALEGLARGPEVQAGRGREAWPQGCWRFHTSCFSSSYEPRAWASGQFPVLDRLQAPAPGPFPRSPRGLRCWPMSPPLPCRPAGDRRAVLRGGAVHAPLMTAWVSGACSALLLYGAQGLLWGHRPGLGPVPSWREDPLSSHTSEAGPLRLGRCPLLPLPPHLDPSGPGAG